MINYNIFLLLVSISVSQITNNGNLQVLEVKLLETNLSPELLFLNRKFNIYDNTSTFKWMQLKCLMVFPFGFLEEGCYTAVK